MDMEQFSLLLCDVYQMDYTVCPYDLRWRVEFEKTSLQQWAIDEIRRYVAGWLRPRTEGKVQDYRKYIPLASDWYWLATSYSPLSGNDYYAAMFGFDKLQEVLKGLQKKAE